MQVTDTTIHSSGSADFIIDNRFMLQLGTDGEFSIPRAINAAWDDEDAQDEAAENLDADKAAEESGAATIARAADLLRKVETYANENEDFASGDYANGYDFWSVSDVGAVDRHNDYTYNSAQRVACRGLSSEHADIAFKLAAADDCRE